MLDAPITPEQLLAAYASGYFPMADSRESEELHWYYPVRRGILPLEQFHEPRSLKKFLRNAPYDIKMDTAFEQVIRGCAEAKSGARQDSWINERIITLYCQLAHRGYAHSVETWHEGKLVGGLYGVSLGGAFFGESMFSVATNASKAALVYLVERLRRAGYVLLDTQYINDHLRQFGAIEIPRSDYLVLLANALKASPNPSTRLRMESDIKS